MIWEVDEDCDGCVNWAEFQAMFERCRDDRAGTEPRQLFNVVQFVIHDREGVGRVSLEEALRIIYLRVGRVRRRAGQEGRRMPPGIGAQRQRCYYHAADLYASFCILLPTGLTGCSAGGGVWHQRHQQRQDARPLRVPLAPACQPAGATDCPAYHAAQGCGDGDSGDQRQR